MPKGPGAGSFMTLGPGGARGSIQYPVDFHLLLPPPPVPSLLPPSASAPSSTQSTSTFCFRPLEYPVYFHGLLPPPGRRAGSVFAHQEGQVLKPVQLMIPHDEDGRAIPSCQRRQAAQSGDALAGGFSRQENRRR
eukprot:scaffold14891_cov82-Isochrysis_galbana.AAC.2